MSAPKASSIVSLLELDRDELVEALRILDKFSIPIPKKLTQDIRAYRAELQKRKTS